MEEKEKCNCENKCKRNTRDVKFSQFIIILLVFTFALIFGLVFGGKVMLDESKKVEEVKIKDLSINYYNLNNTIEMLSELDNLNRNILDVKDLTEQEMLLFALNRIGYVETIKLSEINEITMKFFGREVNPENIKCFVDHKNDDNVQDLYLYDEEKKEFISNSEHGAHGFGSMFPYVLNRIVNLKVSSDCKTYTVEVKKVFGYTQDIGPVLDFYKNIDDMYGDGDAIISCPGYTEEEIFMFDPEWEFKHIDNDELDTYTYVFELINNDFVLKSYKFR